MAEQALTAKSDMAKEEHRQALGAVGAITRESKEYTISLALTFVFAALLCLSCSRDPGPTAPDSALPIATQTASPTGTPTSKPKAAVNLADPGARTPAPTNTPGATQQPREAATAPTPVVPTANREVFAEPDTPLPAPTPALPEMVVALPAATPTPPPIPSTPTAAPPTPTAIPSADSTPTPSETPAQEQPADASPTPITKARATQARPTLTPPASTPLGRINPGALEKARELAAKHFALSPGLKNHIIVEDWEAGSWSDGSLGCAREGMMYTQAEVPGFRITLHYKGKVVDAHTDESGRRAEIAVDCLDISGTEWRPKAGTKPAQGNTRGRGRKSRIIDAAVQIPDKARAQHYLHVVSSRSSSSCTRPGGYTQERASRYGISVTITHRYVATPGDRCTKDIVTDYTTVPLGMDLESGKEYTVNVNGTTTVPFTAR